MHSGGDGWLSYLPLAIVAVVLVLRVRGVNRARHLRIARLWILPVLVVPLIGVGLVYLHPGPAGWLAALGGLVAGGLIGAQRARLMRIHVEGEGADARVMVRNTPAAILLLVAVFAARRLLLPSHGAVSPDHPAAGALLVADAAFGFAAGMIVLLRLGLWLRARRALAAGAVGRPD